MRSRTVPILFLGLLLLSSISMAQSTPVAVSPGGTVSPTRIAEMCPTFHWGMVEGATTYELVVLRQARVPEMGAELDVFFQVALPGSAHGWTPSLDRCLQRGEVYAWTVRAISGASVSAWSEASVFEVSQIRVAGTSVSTQDSLGPADFDPTVASDVRGAAVDSLREQLQNGTMPLAGDEVSGDDASVQRARARRQNRPSLARQQARREKRATARRARRKKGKSTRVGSLSAPLSTSNLVPLPVAAPSTPDPSLSVSTDIALGAASNIFKDGDLFLWDDVIDRNVALGREALSNNTIGFNNTASGFQALLSNTDGYFNTAIGTRALYSNQSGYSNTAAGDFALYRNTGSYNTGIGDAALYSNTTAYFNTGVGGYALFENITGAYNTALGSDALTSNTTGYNNTAVGYEALYSNSTGGYNVAVGTGALHSVTGDYNIGLGTYAGSNPTGSYNIHIGNVGEPLDANTIRIGDTDQNQTFVAGIHLVTVGGTNHAVYVDNTGKLGQKPSSRRFKLEIEDLADSSNSVMDLRPVSFRYKRHMLADGSANGPRSWGLIAEEVEEIFPELVLYDENGKPNGVRYYLLSTLLLNELQKRSTQIESQEGQLAEQARELEKLQERMAQLEALQRGGQD